ncbi:hypothetical protein ACLOJK_019087 [Asimina triloba]
MILKGAGVGGSSLLFAIRRKEPRSALPQWSFGVCRQRSSEMDPAVCFRPSHGSPMERSPEWIAQLDLPAVPWGHGRGPPSESTSSSEGPTGTTTKTTNPKLVPLGGPTLERPFFEGPIGKPTLPAAAPFLWKKGRLWCIKPGTVTLEQFLSFRDDKNVPLPRYRVD